MEKETSFGNVLIAQSGGPTMVINQSLVGVVLAAKASPKVKHVYGALHGIQGILDGTLIDLGKESSDTLEKVAVTPSSALGSVRRKPTAEDCAAILKIFHARNIKWFFYIGGNDSAETVKILSEHAAAAQSGVVCFHVPKTIDNDLRENDHTPGFGSAARFVASAVMGDDLDLRALGGVKIDIVMGRNAGFLAAAAALGRVEPDDGPHLIYLPERPFSPDAFVQDVSNIYKRLGRCVVVVSEGISDRDGVPYATKFLKEVDSHGNVQLSGSGALGDALVALLRARARPRIKRMRADTFGYLQRSFPGVASSVDSQEARAVGKAAFEAAASGQYASGSVAIKRLPGETYGVSYEVVPLAKVAKETKSMRDEFITPEGNNVTKAFLDYARPLIGELPVKGYLQAIPADD